MLRFCKFGSRSTHWITDQREVLNWLTDLKLPQYYENFNSNGYDMVSIRGVTPEDLTDVGVTKAGHRKKLLSEIAKLGTADRIPNHKPDDVVTWLQLLGLQQYEENFMEGGFDDIDFIKDLDKNDLEMIEIRKKGHQKKLLMAVQRLTDLDLTADLDLVVEAQPVTSVPPSTSSDLSPMPPPPPPSMLEDLQTELNTNEPDFPMVPPPPPIDEFDLDPMSLRDNLPPPPGEESTSTYTHQPVKPEPPEQFRDRSMTAPNAPRTKPKPKPVAMKGQVRTASEYHAKESPPKAVVLPTPIAQPKQQVANGNSQDTVEVTAASSRGFWMQQMSQDSESNSAPQTPKRAMTVSGTRPPVTSPKPPPLIKPKPSKPSKEGVEIKSPGPNSKPSPPPTTPRKPTTGKKVPPPAPPRRDSKPTMDTQNVVLNNNNEEQPIERSRTLSGPLDEKIKEVFRGEPKKPSANIPKPMSVAPIIEQPLTEETPKQSLDDQIEETDLLMADIDNMIADFSSQLDSMF